MTRSFFQPKVVALVPAVSEEAHIALTIEALRNQTRQVDRIVVVINNCHDDTEKICRNLGVEVLVIPGFNPHRKAGALNAGLDLVLPELEDFDGVLMIDADTMLNDVFVEHAVKNMRHGVGGVCARYDSTASKTILERLQSNEFARSRRSLSRRDGNTKILVGIAAMFSAGTLRAVIEARRSGKLPGAPAVYNVKSYTEDYELTLALKTLGLKLICPEHCRPTTDAMKTIKNLWRQRVRWSRGALEDLELYGYTAATRSYILAQVGRMLTMMSPIVYVLYLVSLYLAYGHINWSLPWMLVNVVFVGSRVLTVRHEGRKAMTLAALIVPELLYDWFMGAAYFAGLVKWLKGSALQWADT